MIALINLLNVNRVQNQRTARLNHFPPIITGVKLSLTAATGRFFFFLRRALEMKISGRAHARPFIHCLYVTVEPVDKYTEGTIDSVRINSVSVLRGLDLEKMYGLSFSRDKVNCPLRNNEVSILSGVRLYSICGRTLDALADIKITQQWKSTLRACL